MSKMLFTIVAAGLSAVSLSGCSEEATTTATPETTPETLMEQLARLEMLPTGATLSKTTQANGTQNYKCDGTAWVLDGPEADLFIDGVQVGTHFFDADDKGGKPVWEGLDESRVTVKLLTAIDSPDGADNIKWLLTEKTSSEGTADSEFGGMSNVVRAKTVEGVAPSTACNAANTDAISKIDYTCDYLFFVTPETLIEQLARLEMLPTGATLSKTTQANGTQNYKCTGTAWELDGVKADLFIDGVQVGTHFFEADGQGGNPVWKGLDESRVTVKLLKSIDSPDGTDNIKWLLTEKTSSEGTADSEFGGMSNVVRAKTVKGVAPSTACNAANTEAISKIDYTCDYLFFVKDAAAVEMV